MSSQEGNRSPTRLETFLLPSGDRLKAMAAQGLAIAEVTETSLGATLGDRFDRALGLASELHRSQTRKGTQIPYIAHLLIVAGLVIEHGGSEDQAIAGLLHDAAEDQGGEETLQRIEGEFGPAVAAIVADCTDAWIEPKPAWRARKEKHLANLRGKPPASLLVSLADKTHNAESIVADRQAIGEDIWSRFNGGRDGTRWYYRAMSDVFSELIPSPLSERLARAVASLERDVD